MKPKKQIKRLEQDVLSLISTMDGRIRILEGKLIEAQRHPVDQLPPVLQVEDDKRGLDMLFDRVQMYRHKCTKCSHHLVNRLPNGCRCTVCKSPMIAQPVVKRGTRGKYKKRAMVKA